MKSKEDKIFKCINKSSNWYIVGKLIKECNKTYKYKLIKSNYKHNPKYNYYLIWKSIANQIDFKWYNDLDELMIDEL